MSTLDEILATLRALHQPETVVRTFLVAPDVWDRLCTVIPICRGSSFTVEGIEVRRSEVVPRGWTIPLDQKGNPILKPRDATAVPPSSRKDSDT